MKEPDNRAWGHVFESYIKDVEKYQGKKFTRIGVFDLERIREMVDFLADETSGDFELFAMPDTKLPDGTKSGLLIVKYDRHFVALGGMNEPREYFPPLYEEDPGKIAPIIDAEAEQKRKLLKEPCAAVIGRERLSLVSDELVRMVRENAKKVEELEPGFDSEQWLRERRL